MIHPYHAMYMICAPFEERNSLQRLFAALETIDPLERRYVVGLTLDAIGGKYDIDLPTEEAVADSMYYGFKKRCLELESLGVVDFAVTYFVVSFMLNLLRSESDPVEAAHSRKWMRGAAKFFAERAESGDLGQESADKMIRMAEEAANNNEANRQLAADRYKRFCEEILIDLLPPKPPDVNLI